MSNNGTYQKQRVVITGLGVITPVGNNVAETWEGIVNGRSGLGPITLMNNDEHTVGGVCEVKNFDADEALGRREARRRDRTQQLATVAAREAMAQA